MRSLEERRSSSEVREAVSWFRFARVLLRAMCWAWRAGRAEALEACVE